MLNKNILSQVLVGTNWVANHLDDPKVTIVEVNTNPEEGYSVWHIPSAILWNLHSDLEEQSHRNIIDISGFENLMSRSGIDNAKTIVLYGDGNNRSATWAFWVLKIYKHGDVRIMDGGRNKWIYEARDTSTDIPTPERSFYKAGQRDLSSRVTQEYILGRISNPTTTLLDTRSEEEYQGKLTSAPGTPQADISRKGRIPGAVNIDWETGFSEDGSFLSMELLQSLYSNYGIKSDNEIILYCRLGVRASYSWFILKYILGFPNARLYDGSWTEWGNSLDTPVENDFI